MSDSAPNLPETNFAVCALGDSSYVDFCEVGIKLDEKLENLGAKRVANRVDCDVDFETIAANFTSDALKSLQIANGVSEEDIAKLAEASANSVDLSSLIGSAEYTPSDPFEAELIEKVLLNENGSEKETYHYSLSLEGSGITYEAGDAIGVIPLNDEKMVEEILSVTGLKGDEVIDGQTLKTYLSENYDINALTKPVISSYGELTGQAELEDLANNSEKLQEYIWGREVIDLLKEYPAEGLTADKFLSILRKIPPRLYSIASAQDYVGEEVHMTIATVRYDSFGRQRKGVASGFLADDVETGLKVKTYIKPNKNFKLPKDGNVPIIMVGPGTGIAPFRSFIQQRDADGAKGKNWLFFGEQRFLNDFLYQIEWQDFYKKGLLTKFDAAFSRDTPEKVYVQHRMWQNREELFGWLEDGAYFYVCGDESRMAKDVDAMLHKIISNVSGKGDDFAAEYVTTLKKQERYLRDVY